MVARGYLPLWGTGGHLGHEKVRKDLIWLFREVYGSRFTVYNCQLIQVTIRLGAGYMPCGIRLLRRMKGKISQLANTTIR